MAVQEASDVENSKRYDELSPKRKEIVDAWAELYIEQGEEPNNVDVVDKADSDPSYVSETLSDHKDVARARVEVFENERTEGEVKTTGDPFNGQIDKERNMQTIKDRPVKQTASSESTESDSGGFSYEFSPEEVERIFVDQELPDDLYTAVKREVVQRAFGERSD